jgi:hypothetical protein
VEERSLLLTHAGQAEAQLVHHICAQKQAYDQDIKSSTFAPLAQLLSKQTRFYKCCKISWAAGQELCIPSRSLSI